MQGDRPECAGNCDERKGSALYRFGVKDAAVFNVADGINGFVDNECNCLPVSLEERFTSFESNLNCSDLELDAVGDGKKDITHPKDLQANDGCAPVSLKEQQTQMEFDGDLDQLSAQVNKVSLAGSVELDVAEEFDFLSRCCHDTVVKILSYLDINDLVHKVSLVCKNWHSMAYDPTLWSRVDLRNYVVNDVVMSKIPQICNTIEYICLPDAYNEDFTNYGLKVLAKGCPQLKTLIAPRCGEKFSDDAIIAFTKHCQKLEELHLDSLDITDLTLKCIARNLAGLKVLSLCQVSPITDKGVAEILHSCRSLDQLFVNHNKQITDECFNGISGSTLSLRHLEVMMCNIKPSGVPELGKLSNLEILNLTKCTNLTAEHLIPVLKGCKRLYSLGLNLNKLIDDECVYLILTHLPGLRNIYLVSTIITDKATDILGWKGKCLERVDLGYTKITEVGARTMSEKCQTLKYLGLMRCDQIPDDVVEELVVQYPHIMYSTFIQDAKRLLKRIEDEKGEILGEEHS